MLILTLSSEHEVEGGIERLTGEFSEAALEDANICYARRVVKADAKDQFGDLGGTTRPISFSFDLSGASAPRTIGAPEPGLAEIISILNGSYAAEPVPRGVCPLLYRFTFRGPLPPNSEELQMLWPFALRLAESAAGEEEMLSRAYKFADWAARKIPLALEASNLPSRAAGANSMSKLAPVRDLRSADAASRAIAAISLTGGAGGAGHPWAAQARRGLKSVSEAARSSNSVRTFSATTTAWFAMLAGLEASHAGLSQTKLIQMRLDLLDQLC